MLNGILCVDKPPEHTSFDVVARMRGIANTKKIGHGGTLDPMATGVLPLFFGRATKACDILPVQDKRYTATFRLGLITDTQDITGTVLEQRPITVGVDEVRRQLESFTGSQSQVPPMYSAVQVGGKRLYDLARRGIEVERPSRNIVIHTLTLLEADKEQGLYTVDASCSKGTYIRTLCHDIGLALGCGATLTALRRTAACGFTLEQCITLEQAATLAGQNQLEEALLPVEKAFATLPACHLDAKLAALFCNGVPLWLSQLSPEPQTLSTFFREDGTFLGLASPDSDKGQLKIEKLFHLE